MAESDVSPGSAELAWLRWLAHLPLWVFRGAGAVIGLALLLFGRRRRRIVTRNLALCFPEASVWQRARWTWQTFKHFGQSFVDRVWLWHGDPERVQRRVRLMGTAHLPEDGPVLLFAPHFVGLDAAWTRLTQAVGRQWWTMYSRQRNPWMNLWVRSGRRRFGAPKLLSRGDAMRGLLKGLRGGDALYLLPDLDLGAHESVFVPFFGHDTATVTSLSRLARLSGAPVLPCVSRLVASGYEVELLPAWPGYPGDDDTEATARMNRELERYVRTMPGQYHWLHRRFKTRPPGQPSLYRP
jgi:Kdo2-lipid IVA lauroyltransferase/acyltransferase